ncbi:MAG TPA: hypothetical protein VHU80_02855 [Polyangiaceae bacterium]|jgi:hypothetical protein|nr:hypothetical protein [Polyangiaceae bacterium]
MCERAITSSSGKRSAILPARRAGRRDAVPRHDRNPSHQIEHHLFPDLPARRYSELAPAVRAIAEKYGEHYETGPLLHQFSTVVRRILRQSLPS